MLLHRINHPNVVEVVCLVSEQAFEQICEAGGRV